MSGADGPSRRRAAGDGYPPPPAQHAPHSARATPPPAGPPPPPPHHNPPPHSSFAYRRELSPPPAAPDSRGPSSASTNPRHSHSHPGAPTSYPPPPLYEGPHPSQLPPTPLRHRTHPVDDRRPRDYDSRPYDRRPVPDAAVADDEDPRRMPMTFRFDYPRDYPYPDRPPQHDGSMYPSPPPPSRPSGPTASGSVPPVHEHPPHAYPLPTRGPPPTLASSAAESSYVSGGVITNSPSGGSPSTTYERGALRPRSPLPPPPRDIHSRSGRDELSRRHPTPSPMPQASHPRATYFTPAPGYNPKEMSGREAAAYSRGYKDAMEAVQHGVVWIEGKAYSQIPMLIPDGGDWNQPPDGRREPYDRQTAVERAYGRPPSAWDERDVNRDELGPYGASRSHSAPVPRAGLPPYPPEYYRPNGPPGYGYPPAMEPGPHYPVHMGGPPMGPYMGPEYAPHGQYYSMQMRPPGQQMRSRQQISCHPCRNRKVKCSGTTPCEACVKIKRERDCVYEKTVRRRGKGKKAGGTSEDNGEVKHEERQSEDERRDFSTSPAQERRDCEHERRHREHSGDRELRDVERKRLRSRSRSPPRRAAPARRRSQDSQ